VREIQQGRLTICFKINFFKLLPLQCIPENYHCTLYIYTIVVYPQDSNYYHCSTVQKKIFNCCLIWDNYQWRCQCV